MRINARLDEARSRKLVYLTRTTHRCTSDVIKRAIDVYYEQVKHAQLNPEEILKRTGFIGCGEAANTLSEHYKEALSESLSSKHDHR